MNWKKVAFAVTREAFSLGSLALIGWGIFRFFKGIQTGATPDVYLLKIPWSPFFMGYTNGAQYDFFMGAEPLGAIFFPVAKLLWGVPIPVMWPTLLGIYLLSPKFPYPPSGERSSGKRG